MTDNKIKENVSIIEYIFSPAKQGLESLTNVSQSMIKSIDSLQDFSPVDLCFVHNNRYRPLFFSGYDLWSISFLNSSRSRGSCSHYTAPIYRHLTDPFSVLVSISLDSVDSYYYLHFGTIWKEQTLEYDVKHKEICVMYAIDNSYSNEQIHKMCLKKDYSFLAIFVSAEFIQHPDTKSLYNRLYKSHFSPLMLGLNGVQFIICSADTIMKNTFSLYSPPEQSSNSLEEEATRMLEEIRAEQYVQF